MYHFIDRPVSSLDNGGRFLIWAMRSWVKAIGDRTCPTNVVADAFRKWDMLSGLNPFLRTMALFNRHGLENFQFCALACNHVSEHEAIIISLMVSLRKSSPEAVHQTIGLLIEEECIGDLLSSLSALANAMAAAGIYPDWPADQVSSVIPRAH